MMYYFDLALDELRYILQESIHGIKKVSCPTKRMAKVPYLVGDFNTKDSRKIAASLYKKNYMHHKDEGDVFDDRILTFANSWLASVSYIQIRDEKTIIYYFFGSLFDVYIEISQDTVCRVCVFVDGGAFSHLMEFVRKKHSCVSFFNEDELDELIKKPVDDSPLNYSVYLSDIKGNPICLINEFVRAEGGVIIQTAVSNEVNTETFICDTDFAESFVNRIFQIRYNIEN